MRNSYHFLRVVLFLIPQSCSPPPFLFVYFISLPFVYFNFFVPLFSFMYPSLPRLLLLFLLSFISTFRSFPLYVQVFLPTSFSSSLSLISSFRSFSWYLIVFLYSSFFLLSLISSFRSSPLYIQVFLCSFSFSLSFCLLHTQYLFDALFCLPGPVLPQVSPY